MTWPFKYAVVFAAYLVIIFSFSLLLFQASSPLALGSTFDNGGDRNGTLWYQWFAKRCVFNLDFTSLHRTDFIAYPSGEFVTLNLGYPILPILSIPLQIAFDFPTYYNIFALILMAMNGLACFMLLKYMYKDILTAFIGGLFFCVNSYVFYNVNVGRIEQAAIFWFPLFILLLLKMKAEKNKIYSMSGALLLVLASLSYWYYGTFLLIFTFLFVLYFIFAERQNWLGLAKNITLFLCLYCTCMVILFAYPVLIQGIRPVGYEIVRSFPSFNDIALNKTPVYFQFMIFETSFPRLPHLFLAITIGIIILPFLNVRSLKNNLFYILMAVLFFILSLGPYFVTAGYAISLPYIFLYYTIPFFSRLWWPINCFSITLICTSILIAGLIHWIRSKAKSKTKIILPVVLAIIYLFPYYNAQYNIAGYPHWLKMEALVFSKFDKPHEVYYYLKGQPDCAILELPFDRSGQIFMHNQTIHEKKVFEGNGYLEKEVLWSKKHLEYLRSNELLRSLDLWFSYKGPIEASPYKDLLDEESVKSGLRQLYSSGFRFIVISPYYLRSYESKDWLYAKLKEIFKKPYKEYPDGYILYKIEELINVGAGSPRPYKIMR